MRKILWIVLLVIPSFICAQHTFSIVAVDAKTREVGSAGATCLDNKMLEGEEGALTISEIIPNVGAIHTQAFWDPENQKNARKRKKPSPSFIFGIYFE